MHARQTKKIATKYKQRNFCLCVCVCVKFGEFSCFFAVGRRVALVSIYLHFIVLFFIFGVCLCGWIPILDHEDTACL